jgi:hypothetical protein
LKKTTFFTLPRPHFTEECPGFDPCTLIEPEDLSTLQVFTNGQTHIKWNFRQNYELNHGAPAGSNFYKFKSVVKTIESVLSQYSSSNNNNNYFPETNCHYA